MTAYLKGRGLSKATFETNFLYATIPVNYTRKFRELSETTTTIYIYIVYIYIYIS